MARKNLNENESPKKKSRKGITPFTFLDNQFDEIDSRIAKRHILYLVLSCVAAKVIVAFVTVAVFHSFIDLFDIGVYFQHVTMLIQGQWPFAGEFQYPVLIFIPLIIAVIPAILFQSVMAFVYTFQSIMILCDIITIICIYLVGIRLWSERIAFHAGLIYAAAFSSAYFVITKYDAFPASLLMLSILLTVYRREAKGYAVSVLGFFTKVFPVLALPFFILYNAKNQPSLKQELMKGAKVVIPLCAILFLPLFVISPDTFRIYIPVRSELGYYSNTMTFTLYSWLHDVFNTGISLDIISAVMYLGMIIGMLILLYIAWTVPGKDPKTLVKLILCAIVLVVICAKVRSPQYIVWFTPLLCLLAIDDFKKIFALFVFQTLAYIEFPLMFGTLYTAVTYTDPVLSHGWIITLIMFTLEYSALVICLWLVVNPRELYKKMRMAAGKSG